MNTRDTWMMYVIMIKFVMCILPYNTHSDSITFTGWGSGQVGGSLDVAGQVDYHMIVIEEGVKGVMRATTVATNDEDGNGSLDDEVGIVWYSDTGGMPYYPENGGQVHDIFTLERYLTPGTYYIIAQAKYLDYGISGSYSIQLDFSCDCDDWDDTHWAGDGTLEPLHFPLVSDVSAYINTIPVEYQTDLDSADDSDTFTILISDSDIPWTDKEYSWDPVPITPDGPIADYLVSDVRDNGSGITLTITITPNVLGESHYKDGERIYTIATLKYHYGSPTCVVSMGRYIQDENGDVLVEDDMTTLELF